MSLEGVTFIVEKKAANVSGTIKQMLSSDGTAFTLRKPYCDRLRQLHCSGNILVSVSKQSNLDR
jgi:hypothetical protein